jgi:hypothetical protein
MFPKQKIATTIDIDEQQRHLFWLKETAYNYLGTTEKITVLNF